MLRVRVHELARGYWQAFFEGEEAAAVMDRSPDQALAGLVRANLRRLGVAEILYASDAPAEEGAGAVPFAGGLTIRPLTPDATRAHEAVEGR